MCFTKWFGRQKLPIVLQYTPIHLSFFERRQATLFTPKGFNSILFLLILEDKIVANRKNIR